MAITFYTIEQGALVPHSKDSPPSQMEKAMWFDLFEPTKEEEQLVEHYLGINVPTYDEMREIESSSRLYIENNTVFTSAMVMTHTDSDEPQSHAISFILSQKKLITVRYSNPYSFRVASTRNDDEERVINSGYGILMLLLETITARLADILENASHQLDEVNRLLFRPAIHDRAARLKAKPDYEDMLRRIGIYGDVFSKAQESLLTIQRLIAFASQGVSPRWSSHELERVETTFKDMSALTEYINFQSSKVNFLLDATLGMVSIEQSGIIKIFSVASVVFLPPTLVASLYGMNFKHMPELHWVGGYPFAIVLMILAALVPYWYFKKKRWL